LGLAVVKDGLEFRVVDEGLEESDDVGDVLPQ